MSESYDEDALFRFRIIAPLINETIPHGQLHERLKEAASQWYEHPRHGWQSYSHRTIEEWYYNYKNKGLSGLERSRRSDHGTSRRISEEVSQKILAMKKENSKRSVPQILRELEQAGMITRGEISESCIYRFLKSNQEEIRRHQNHDTDQKRKFAFARVNECWQSDVCHGPYVHLKGYANKKKLFLYAFMDDASRVVPHAGIALKENLESFLGMLKIALQKKGIPRRLYLDNASYYRSPRLKTIGARLGCQIIHCTPYSPYKKGKIERWWRTCEEQFLSHLDHDEHYDLEELNDLLGRWVEQEYHHRSHASLEGTPLEAWQDKQGELSYPDPETLQRDFLAEDTRRVRNDGTIAFNSTYYEVDSTLAGESVTVRFDPTEDHPPLLVYWREECLGTTRPVDEEANQKAGRKAIDEDVPDVSSGIDYLELLKQKEEEKNV